MSKANNKKNTSGFAMLFAVLLSSILIAVGLSIFNISIKELAIAGSARDSAQSYYAADSARECIVFWDIVKGGFPTCLDGSCSQVSTTSSPTISCNGNQINFQFNASPIHNIDNSWTFYTQVPAKFRFASSTNSDPTFPDANISITKTFIPNNPPTIPSYVSTAITTFGHNTGIVGRRVERGIEFDYSR